MKNMKLIFSQEFVDDFSASIEYIKIDSPHAAKVFARKVYEKIKLLKKFPEIGKALDEPNLESIRILIIGNYLVLYEIKSDENAVYLHGFCHGARDYPNVYKELKK